MKLLWTGPEFGFRALRDCTGKSPDALCDIVQAVNDRLPPDVIWCPFDEAVLYNDGLDADAFKLVDFDRIYNDCCGFVVSV